MHFLGSDDRNPEFRIAEDARVATEAPISMAVGLLSAIPNVIIFIGILWSVGGDVAIGTHGNTWTVPKYLVFAVVIYASSLTMGVTAIGRRMVSIIAGRNAAEAQLRSVASTWRDLAASSEPAEDAQGLNRLVNEVFNIVIARWRDICIQFMRITMIAHGNSLAAPIVAWFLCSPKYRPAPCRLARPPRRSPPL